MCEPRSLKIGPSYIFLDSHTCTQCMNCVKACDRGAIVRHSASLPAGKSAPKARKAAERPSTKLPGKTVPARTQAAADRRSAPAVRSIAALGGPVIWTQLEAVALLVVALTTFLGKDALLGSALVQAMPSQGRVFARVAVLVAFYVVQVGVLMMLAHKRGSSLFAAFGLTRIRASLRSWASAVGWVLLLLFATRIAAWVWGVIAQAIGIDPPGSADGGLAGIFGNGTIGLALTIGLVVIVAPLVEEMLFRGVLLSAIGSRWSAGVALVGQAALFAAYHFSIWMLVPTFLLGLACGYLAQHRGSLWPAVALHALFNAVPVAIVFWAAG
ncbi:MAG: CPBP family glutamic-type intramembrane protease [Actinomycetota bacterium]|nr:CPBP family glutamic-type intramembrane protease [Actinomycetota bacterium]